METIVEVSEDTLFELLRAGKVADENGRSLRISIGENQHGPFIVWAIGQGMWTHPRYTDWRDADCCTRETAR